MKPSRSVSIVLYVVILMKKPFYLMLPLISIFPQNEVFAILFFCILQNSKRVPYNSEMYNYVTCTVPEKRDFK